MEKRICQLSNFTSMNDKKLPENAWNSVTETLVNRLLIMYSTH